MNNYKYRFGIWVLLILLFGASCTNKSVCLEPQSVALRGGFYYSNSDTSIDKDDKPSIANIVFIEGKNKSAHDSNINVYERHLHRYEKINYINENI